MESKLEVDVELEVETEVELEVEPEVESEVEPEVEPEVNWCGSKVQCEGFTCAGHLYPAIFVQKLRKVFLKSKW